MSVVDGDHFIVHYEGKPGQHVPADEEILSRGEAAIGFATIQEGWHSVDPSKKHSLAGIGENCFEYNSSPPILNTAIENDNPLREWGSDILDTEIFLLEDLEVFVSTDFELPSLDPEPVPSLVPNLELDESLLTPSSLPQEVRKDGDVDQCKSSSPNIDEHSGPVLEVGSLRKAIEQPHFLPNIPDRLDTKPLNPDPMFFNGSNPIAIPPNTMEQVQEILEDPFARCTWVIPIRGTLPWPDCSSAVILREGMPSSVGSRGAQLKLDPEIASTTTSDVVWTRAAVRAFWQFLVDLRKSENLGPIALSFHAVTSRSGTKTTALANNAPTANTGPKSQKRKVAPGLLDCDHFKIYHDARYAMHLRNVFHAWSYQYSEDSTGTGHERPTASLDDNVAVDVEHDSNVKIKVRLLKNVRLVLLDEVSEAILVC